MILDQLVYAHYYFNLHPGFKKAFDFIRKSKDLAFESQRIHLDGDNLIAIFESPEIRGPSKACLETHRKYIDIQYTLKGTEEIGWKPYFECQQVKQAYHEERDIAFFSDRPTLWLPIPEDSFAIFFPHDAHAPLAGKEPVQKIIMKVALTKSMVQSLAIDSSFQIA